MKFNFQSKIQNLKSKIANPPILGAVYALDFRKSRARRLSDE
jgi:hypothetical protein